MSVRIEDHTATLLVETTRAVTQAAFDQVREVENATFALRAYETDASKVNHVLSELVGLLCAQRYGRAVPASRTVQSRL